MKSQGRPTTPSLAANGNAPKTVSGNKALEQATQLIFETGTPRRTGVDLPEPKGTKSRLGNHARTGEIGLPGLSEPETLRHYVRLSQKNYAIDLEELSFTPSELKPDDGFQFKQFLKNYALLSRARITELGLKSRTTKDAQQPQAMPRLATRQKLYLAIRR